MLFEGIKERCEPTIPAENWANKELYYKDMVSGMSQKELMRNVRNGKYRQSITYPEPHRDEKRKIIIENSQLYYDYVKQHGAYQAQQWVKQGKYNFSPEELEKERERIKKEFEYLYKLYQMYICNILKINRLR